MLGAGFVLVNLVGWKAIGDFVGLSPKPPDDSRPFEILSVTILLRQSDVTFDGKEERHLDVRTMYTIRGIEGLQPTADAMIKRYTKSDAREVRKWNGTVEEAVKSIGPTNIETIARFGIEPQEIRSIAFGAQIIFDLPFSNDDERRAIRDIVKLRSDEAWWGYPNHDGTSIPVVTIIIESPSNDLEVTGNRPAFRVNGTGDVEYDGVLLGPSEAKAASGSLWASWKDVQVDELVAFRYKWRERTQ